MEIADNSTIQPLAVNDPLCSSDSVWYKDNENLSVSDKFDEVEAAIATKADAAHTHTEYASSSDLTALEDVINTKANLSHTHTEYASVNHGHSDYVTMVEFDMLNDEISSKADASHTHTEYSPSLHTHNEYAEVNHAHTEYATTTHTHSNYATVTALETLESEVDGKASSTHTHDDYAAMTHTHDEYASVSHTHTASEIGAAVSGHNHNEDYADINHNHDSVYAVVGHDHNENYASIDHSHTDYATVDSLNEVSTIVSGKANVSHSHDDIYYTETEIDAKLANKAEATHTHTGVYDVSGSAESALSSSKDYTDSKIDALVGEGASTTLDTIGEIASAIEDNQDMIDALNAAIGNKANTADLTSHTGNTTIHVTETEKAIWNAKSDFSGNYNDLTNKPTIPSVNGLATEVYVDEKVSGITVESIGALPDTTVIPTIPTNISSFTNDVGYLTEHQSLDGLASITYVDAQIDAIDIPFALSDLVADSTHRTVTDTEKAAWNAKSNFSGSYNDLTNKPTIPSIDGLATETYVDEAVSAKANSSHTHTIANISGLQNTLNGKSDSTHNHNTSYDVLGAANTALASAKEYTDDAIADEVTARDSAIATAKSSAISTASSDATTKIASHNTSTSTHNDIRVLIADLTTKLNNFLDVDDTTTDQLSEVLVLIENNKGTLESLTTSKINTSDIVNNLTTNNTSKVLSAAQGVAIKSLIDTLQTELDDGFEEITSEKIRTLFSN